MICLEKGTLQGCCFVIAVLVMYVQTYQRLETVCQKSTVHFPDCTLSKCGGFWHCASVSRNENLLRIRKWRQLSYNSLTIEADDKWKGRKTVLIERRSEK